MKNVFILHHVVVRELGENVKLIGVYTSRALAEMAVTRLQNQPGFRDYPDGFMIDEHDLNRDNWTEGFGNAN